MDTKDRMKEGVISTARALGKEVAGTGGEAGTASVVDQATVETVIADWPRTPKLVAERTITKYG